MYTFFPAVIIVYRLWKRKKKRARKQFKNHFHALLKHVPLSSRKAGNRNRTGDLRTTNATHYRLCYASIPFPHENFYMLSRRSLLVNRNFFYFLKNFSRMCSAGIFCPVQSSKAAAP